jgi:hypothetical protein
MNAALGLVAALLVGYIVAEVVAVFGRRLGCQTAFVSAIIVAAFGLIANPITGVLFAPTIAGLIAGAFFWFRGRRDVLACP